MPPKPKDFIEIPITFSSEDQQIVGMLHKSGSPKLVILCHGFTGSKVENRRIFVEAGRAIARDGLDAFRFDFYGSGDSAGEFSDTMISHNIANLRDAIVWARQAGYEKIAVLGLSMGAATAILTLESTPVDALITWSAVPEMEKLFQNYVSNIQDVAKRVDIYEHEGWLIKKAFWQDAVQHDIPGALARLKIPKFIVQGTADAPVFMDGFHMFRNIAQPPADFMEIPGASHTFSAPAHRHQVIRQTLIWLNRNF
jgi:pimeloyl-ACP methyl ester carboxylesterase